MMIFFLSSYTIPLAQIMVNDLYDAILFYIYGSLGICSNTFDFPMP